MTIMEGRGGGRWGCFFQITGNSGKKKQCPFSLWKKCSYLITDWNLITFGLWGMKLILSEAEHLQCRVTKYLFQWQCSVKPRQLRLSPAPRPFPFLLITLTLLTLCLHKWSPESIHSPLLHGAALCVQVNKSDELPLSTWGHRVFSSHQPDPWMNSQVWFVFFLFLSPRVVFKAAQDLLDPLFHQKKKKKIKMKDVDSTRLQLLARK